MEQHTENNEKGGKERVKRRFLQRKNFFNSKNIFPKKKNNQDTKGFLKTLRKRCKGNENKKKKKNREQLRKNQDLQMVQRERKQSKH